MKHQIHRVFIRNGLLVWLAAMLVPQAPDAAAQVTQIPSTPTTMTSTADRMISYRQQEHSWQTSDGAIHLMVNRGNVSTGDSLVLYSSFDGGASWKLMFTLGGTDQYSTSDGLLNDSTHLLLAYAANQTSGAIDYIVATYSPVSKSWAPSRPQVAFSPNKQTGSNPSITVDSAGGVWCGFTVFDQTSTNYNLQMAYRSPQGTTWSSTGLVFGSTDRSPQHSARPVRFNGGVGMVYESDTSMYWTYRTDSQAINAAWSAPQTIYSGLPPVSSNPYDSHFSVVADASANLYLAFVNYGQLFYMRYLSANKLWGPANAMTKNVNAAYPQVTLAGGNLLIFVNNQQSVEVLQSSDYGNTFTATQQLTHPTPPTGSALNYANPRVETPSHALNPVPTFQQYVNGTTQGVMYFAVPLVVNAAATSN